MTWCFFLPNLKFKNVFFFRVKKKTTKAAVEAAKALPKTPVTLQRQQATLQAAAAGDGKQRQEEPGGHGGVGQGTAILGGSNGNPYR